MYYQLHARKLYSFILRFKKQVHALITILQLVVLLVVLLGI